MNNLILFAILLFLSIAAGYHGPDLPKGPFCGLVVNGGQCCRNRQDGCSHEILNTICYCDEFCKDGRQHDDCCPDYEAVCLGEEPPEHIIEPCRHNGQIYLPTETRSDNCNTCTCQLDASNATSWSCTQDQCMVSDNVAFEINRQNAGWRAYSYPEFRNRKLKDGVIYKLGTLPLDQLTRQMNAMSPPNMDKMVNRTTFDARREWPRYISPVRDQGWCGSDWAMSLAAIASDRFAIMSKGAENLELSPQLFLSCLPRFSRACQGGHIDWAWNFARNHGMVDEKCFPYKAEKTTCPFKKRGTLRTDGCQPSVKERTDRYRVSPLGRLKGERAIMADIMLSGPLQAIMTVYQDFFHYRDGVYKHQRVGDQRISGLHSVRVVGWGEDRGEKYWIVANSWGQEWGENGFFRILRGANESGIEDFIVTVLPEVNEAYQRK